MEKYGKENMSEVINGLLMHEITPNERNGHQIQLAGDLFAVMNLDEKKVNQSEKERNDEIMVYWNKEGYSTFYAEIEEGNEFKFHPRLQGDIFRLTPADLIYYKEHKELPEE